MKPVNVYAIVDELSMVSDDWFIYLKRETGEFVSILAEEFRIAEQLKGNESNVADEDGAVIEAIDIIRNPDKYVALPDRFDIHEYGIMESFCHQVADERSQRLLLSAIRGSGAFRRFKDVLSVLDMTEEWYDYRDEAFEEIAVRWCKVNDIPYELGEDDLE